MNIRHARTSDAPAIAAIYAPHVTGSATSFELAAPSSREMARRIRATHRRFPWLVAEQGGRVVGYAYASAHRERAAYRWCAEVSVYVDASARRAGVARRLYRELFALLKRQNYRSLYAGITLPNRASVGFHEALGFRPVGVYRKAGYKLGRWRDVGWWQKRLPGPSGRPPEPKPPGRIPRR